VDVVIEQLKVRTRTRQRLGKRFDQKTAVNLGSVRFVGIHRIYYTFLSILELKPQRCGKLIQNIRDTFMKKAIFLSAIISSVMLAACGGESPAANNAAPTNSAVPTNANANVTTNTGGIVATTPTPETTTNNAPTLSPVYKAYCAAYAKGDEAAIRKIYSTDTLKAFDEDIKESAGEVKNLIDLLKDDGISTELCEARNEKISGDTATAEIRTKGYPNGLVAVFVKEGAEWKLTNRRPEGALTVK
jgi:hypothetical protein